MWLDQVIKVPTGEILVLEGKDGRKLECLSIGDYGKEVNLTEQPVPASLPIMPLSEKWVITISTQYGCSMACTFCDVPLVGPGRNASYFDMLDQIFSCLSRHHEVKEGKRLNIHFARMGEPTFNPAVLGVGQALAKGQRNDRLAGFETVHPVVSTMMPKGNPWLEAFLHRWCDLKNWEFEGEAGLQFSINSTDEIQRQKIFGGKALSLGAIARIAGALPLPEGRKYTLNFAVTEQYWVDPKAIWGLFDPAKFMVKLTPMHRTLTALTSGQTMEADPSSPAPYKTLAEEFRKLGFQTLVFIASEDEDLSKITCGNAILATGAGRTV